MKDTVIEIVINVLVLIAVVVLVFEYVKYKEEK